MSKFSRRGFFRRLGVFAGGVAALTAEGGAFSPRPAAAAVADRADPFNLLVVGDSLVWGQGLEEKDKSYFLVKNWLEAEVLKNSRRLNTNVKAHSGARIRLQAFEREALGKAAISETHFFHPELNLSFPSIWSQLDAARADYEDPQMVDLILLSGGVTNVGLSQILDPRKSNRELKLDITRHCHGEMFSLLEYAALTFPRALVVLLGYYPFLSRHTPSSMIFNNVLEVYDFPNYLKPVLNNPLNRRLLRSYRNKMIERSMIWAADSTREFKRAVERLNTQQGGRRAVFVESPIGAENSMGAPQSLLYEVGRDDRAQDARAAERRSECRTTLVEVGRKTGLKFSERRCELATIGHPTPDGARAYAAAIQNALKALLGKENI